VTRDDEKEVREDEAAIADWAHHSVVTAEEIDSGEQFTNENLTTKRPGTGVPADEFYDVIGGTAARDFDANEVIHPDDVE
jgi:sialic acid synthase SpsE